LYIEGVDLAKDLVGTEFLNYLGIEYGADGQDFEIDLLYGADVLSFSGVNFMYRGGSDAHYRIDHIQSELAEPIYISDDEIERMLLNETENYKSISSSIIFGALTDGENLNKKAYLISEMVDYFLDSTLVLAGPKTPYSQSYIDFRIYPNPFAVSCTIVFKLKASSHIRVEIRNEFGQRVGILHDGALLQGTNQFVWDGIGSFGNKLSPGLYFICITSNDGVFVKTVILK